jgi:hypothetical protein
MKPTKLFVASLLLAGTLLPPCSFSQLDEGKTIPGSRVVWHTVGRAFLNPMTGKGEVVGYFSQIEGIPAPFFGGAPSEGTAFFTFRSDVFSLEPLPINGDVNPNLVTPGTFSIFFSPTPNHNWLNPDSFSGGQLIATFNRAEGQTVLTGATGYSTFSAALAFSSEIAVNGRNVDFAKLTPLGVTETAIISFTPIASAGTKDFSFVAPFTTFAVAIGDQPTDSKRQ